MRYKNIFHNQRVTHSHDSLMQNGYVPSRYYYRSLIVINRDVILSKNNFLNFIRKNMRAA